MADHSSISCRYVSICSFLVILLVFFQYVQGPPIPLPCANYDTEWVPRDLNVDREPQPEEHDINYDSGITHWCVLEPKMIRRNSMLNFGQNIAHTGKAKECLIIIICSLLICANAKMCEMDFLIPHHANQKNPKAESLLPCWSMLYELGATHNCGIDTTRLKSIKGWMEQLVREAMKCRD